MNKIASPRDKLLYLRIKSHLFKILTKVNEQEHSNEMYIFVVVHRFTDWFSSFLPIFFAQFQDKRTIQTYFFSQNLCEIPINTYLLHVSFDILWHKQIELSLVNKRSKPKKIGLSFFGHRIIIYVNNPRIDWMTSLCYQSKNV